VTHDLERIRDYVHGRLPPAERKAFAAAISRDAALAELVETYELVVQATPGTAPAATTTFGDVMVRARAQRRIPRPLLMAAALLLAVGLFYGIQAAIPRAPGPVTLTSIPLALLPAPEAPPDWPRDLLTHRTADENGLVFSTDMDRALALARVAQARVFLFLHFPGCPWCEQFREVQSRDERVEKAAAPYVLLTLDWREAPEGLRENPNDGWPIFDVLDAEGKRIDGFKGLRPAAGVAAFLEKSAPAAQPDWEGLGEGARKLEEAERTEDPARRFDLYRQVAAAENTLGEVARARIAATRKEAQDALFAAREDARTATDRLGAVAAADRLSAAATALRGTPYAADLEKVLAFVRKHGSFPDLKE